jgi:hypothetical protein
MAWEKYALNFTPKGYRTDVSADLLPSVSEWQYLVAGSQNVLIDDDGSVTSRAGTTILWQAGTTWWVKWAQKWTTSTNSDRHMRSVFDTLQVYYEWQWYDVASWFGNNTEFCGDSWYDRDQLMDRFIWVNKTTQMYSWQGGITRVASRVSDTSLKKENGGTPTGKSVLNTATSSMSWGYPIDAQNPTAYTSLQGINTENFWEAGFREGDTFTTDLSGIAWTYTVASVNPTTNELIITTTFGGTGASSIVGQGITGTVNAYWPLAKTFAQERFASSGAIMGFSMLGVNYTYTGGFNTDTLTGISPALPAVIPAGTIIMSRVYAHTPAGGDFTLGATPNILVTSINQAWVADTNKNWVWLSSLDDFTDFTYSVPVRANWEGGSARLDKNVIALVANSQDNSVRASCGSDSWYPISLVSVTSNDVAGEEIRVGVPTRGAGLGANNQYAVCNTKEWILYLSQDPSFDYLQNIYQNNQVVTPVWEDIDFDLQNSDLTGAKTIFWRNHVWLLLPNESKLYWYDMRRRLWQPPQIIAGNALSVIDSQLIVHSSIKNESYTMFSGTNDDGNPISHIARYSYSNYGTRERYKAMDGYYVEAKVTDSTDVVKFTAYLGYKWSQWTVTDVFGAADGAPYVENPSAIGWFGFASFGQMPNGSLFTSDELIEYKKVRRIFPFTKNWVEYFEMQVEFSCDKINAQFKILAHGDNMELSGSRNSNLIKI